MRGKVDAGLRWWSAIALVDGVPDRVRHEQGDPEKSRQTRPGDHDCEIRPQHAREYRDGDVRGQLPEQQGDHGHGNCHSDGSLKDQRLASNANSAGEQRAHSDHCRKVEHV